jgi:DNA-binding HxlR family transcriptional regulator
MNPKLECPIMSTIAMVSDKWKVLIICKLRQNKLRFTELRRELTGITQRVLTHQLRELEADGLVFRRVFAEVPPRVEYSLTELGGTLWPALQHLEDWAHEHADELMATRLKKESALNQQRHNEEPKADAASQEQPAGTRKNTEAKPQQATRA